MPTDGGPPDVTTPAPDAASPVTPCEDPPGGDWTRQLYRLENNTEQTRVILERHAAGQGVGESTLFELRRLSILRQGKCVHITDPTRLAYDNSHHNWRDTATAAADGAEYAVSLISDIGSRPATWKLTLTGNSAATGASLFEPMALTATAGPLGCLYDCPSSLPLVISEFMANNRTTWRDEQGLHVPWIELFNPSAEAIDVTGYHLSDDPGNPTKWPLPPDTVIARHGYLLIAADGEPQRGALHSSFRLQKTGGWLRLSGPNGVSAGERNYGPQPADTSLRLDVKQATYLSSSAPTPGA